MSGHTENEGIGLKTLDVLVKFTMPRETAEKVKRRFEELSRDGGEVSYLDCVLFDAALATLGEEQAYYGIDDTEWRETTKARAKAEAGYAEVRVIDIAPDSWHVACTRQRDRARHEAPTQSASSDAGLPGT